MGATALGALAVPVLIGLVTGPRSGVRGCRHLAPARRSSSWAVRLRRPTASRPATSHELRAPPRRADVRAPCPRRSWSDFGHGRLPRRGRPRARAIIRRVGDAGDRFYVIVSGELEVDVAGRAVRHQGPGEAFGEIALLRDVPERPLSALARDVTLLAVEREPFLCRADRSAAEPVDRRRPCRAASRERPHPRLRRAILGRMQYAEIDPRPRRPDAARAAEPGHPRSRAARTGSRSSWRSSRC